MIEVDFGEALFNGSIGMYEAWGWYKSKGGSIWVRTKRRYRTPAKVLPLLPLRTIHFDR